MRKSWTTPGPSALHAMQNGFGHGRTSTTHRSGINGFHDTLEEVDEGIDNEDDTKPLIVDAGMEEEEEEEGVEPEQQSEGED